MILKWFISLTTFNILEYNSHTIQFTHLKCIINVFVVCSEDSTIITTINFRIFLSPQKETFVSIKSPTPSDPLSSRGFPLSESTYLPTEDISDKWNHTESGLVLLTYFT